MRSGISDLFSSTYDIHQSQGFIALLILKVKDSITYDVVYQWLCGSIIMQEYFNILL